jgi:hypothetical protein
MSNHNETEGLPPRARGARNDFTAEELEELRDLYAELSTTTDAAAELLGADGPMLTGMRFERFVERNERIASLLVEIDGLLTR